MNFDSSVLQVAIEDIIPNRFQPRLAFEDKSLQELAESIKQHGIIQPLVLRRVGEKYEIIAGERRYKAATMAGLASVPAVVSQIDDKTSAEVAVVENVQRKNLSAIEEAKSYKALLDQGYMSQDQLAKKMGLSQSAVSNKLRLLTLPEEVQLAVMDNKISERHARSLLAVKDPVTQVELTNRVIEERLTVRALDTIIRSEINSGAPTLNIDTIKKTAEDIKPASVNNVVEAHKEDAFKMGAINLGQRTQNKFFNNLEDEAANMQMTEAINPFNNFNNNSDLEATTAVDTQVNKAEAIEEKPKIEFSAAPETVLSMPSVPSPASEVAPEEIYTSPEPPISATDMPSLAPNKPESKEEPFKGPSIFDFMKTESADLPSAPSPAPVPAPVATPAAPVAPAPEPVPAPVAAPAMPETPSVPVPEPAPTVNAIPEIDSLDSLDFEPPKTEKDVTPAVDKINNMVNELRIENYNITSLKTDLVDQVTITITIKKD